MVEPLVSVVICTYNRVEFLHKCLDSLLRQRNAPPFEIIVVDNHSTDSTSDFVHSYSKRINLPIRYVLEPIQGLSRARNTGLKAANGKIVAFLDDDATASEGWVQAIEEGNLSYPEFAVQMGPVYGEFETPRPDWLSSKNDFAISIGNPGNEFREMKAGEPIIGANMAICRDVFDQIGGFIVDLGRIGTSLLAAEDVEFCDRLLQQQYKILNNPKMEIWHWVPKSRLSKPYIHERMYWNGRSIAVWDQIRGRSIVLRALTRIMYKIPLDGIGMLITWKKEDERFYHSCQIKKHCGYISQVLKMITQPTEIDEL